MEKQTFWQGGRPLPRDIEPEINALQSQLKEALQSLRMARDAMRIDEEEQPDAAEAIKHLAAAAELLKRTLHMKRALRAQIITANTILSERLTRIVQLNDETVFELIFERVYGRVPTRADDEHKTVYDPSWDELIRPLDQGGFGMLALARALCDLTQPSKTEHPEVHQQCVA